MTIVIYYEWTIDPQFGGVERMSVVLADMLSSLGHKVLFLCKKKILDISLKYPLTYLPNEKEGTYKEYINSFVKKNSIDVFINQACLLPQSKDISMAFKAANVHIVQVLHNSLYGLYSRINALDKLCLYVPLLQFFLSNRYVKHSIIQLFKIKYYKYYRWLGQSNDNIILLSDKYKNEYMDFCHPRNPDKIRAISNPITFVVDNNNYKKEKIILFCGRMDSQKRPLRALKIWERISKEFKDWRFIMLGDGEYLPTVRTYVEKKHISNVEILGRQNPMPYYKKSSILCLTSSYEGLPLVVLEAFNYGCVPICYNTFACASEIITDGKDGVLVDKDTINGYVEKLRLLLKDECLRNFMKSNRFDKLSRYSPEIVIKSWNKLINEIDT